MVRPVFNTEQPTYADASRRQYANMPICQYAYMPTLQYVNTPICQYANMPLRQYADMPRCQYGNTLIMPIRHCANMSTRQYAKYVNTPIYQSINAPNTSIRQQKSHIKKCSHTYVFFTLSGTIRENESGRNVTGEVRRAKRDSGET